MFLDRDIWAGEGHMGCLVAGPAHLFLFFVFFLFFLLHADVLHFLTLVWCRLASRLTRQSGNAVLSRHASLYRLDSHVSKYTHIFTCMLLCSFENYLDRCICRGDAMFILSCRCTMVKNFFSAIKLRFYHIDLYVL